MIKSRWSQNLLLGVVSLLLLALVWWGWNNGVSAAKAKRIVKDAKIIATAFEDFKKDQNRYPVTTEFGDAKVMRTYIANFPPQNYPSAVCPQTFDYFNPSPQTYELRFCLPKAVGGYKVGWNVIKP